MATDIDDLWDSATALIRYLSQKYLIICILVKYFDVAIYAKHNLVAIVPNILVIMQYFISRIGIRQQFCFLLWLEKYHHTFKQVEYKFLTFFCIKYEPRSAWNVVEYKSRGNTSIQNLCNSSVRDISLLRISWLFLPAPPLQNKFEENDYN